MEITIGAQPNSIITKKLNLTLGNYTILAGVNNSGKTSIINAIIDDQKKIDGLKDYKIIYIPADRVKPDKELKNTVKGDPFYAAIATLLSPIFSAKMMDDLKKDFQKEKVELVKGVNKILKDSGVDDTELDISLKDINEAIVIKLATALAKDLSPPAIEEVELDKIGTGALRMILVALIRYYEESKKPLNGKTLLILEEPEICLHPKWKEKLYTSLEKLSGEGVKVLITTHDPYFIELGKNRKIWEVRRNKKTGATEIEEFKENSLLGYKSDAEINYAIFKIPSRTYFLELYERLLSLFSKSCLKCPNPKYGQELTCTVCGGTVKWPKQELLNAWAVKNKDGKIGAIRVNTKDSKPLVTDTRNEIGHPEDNEISPEVIGEGIKELSKMIPEKRKELK